MADVTLRDGREITIDLYQITRREWIRLFDESQSADDEDTTIAKACGLSLEEYQSIPVVETRKITAALLKKAKEPLADPN